jgi:hypothetical protein
VARSEARLSVEIWARESDFINLTTDAQWMFTFLLSQPDLAHSGVLPLRTPRWASKGKGLTVEQIQSRLEELEHQRYVIIDRESGEVLIRSFIRQDKVYRQPNVFLAAKDNLPLVESPIIRSALATELRRVQELEMPEGSRTILLDMLKELGEPLLKPEEIPHQNPPGNPSGESSGDASAEATAATPGERGVVTAVSSDSPVPGPQAPDQNLPSSDGDELEPGDGVLFGEPAPPPEPPPLPHTHPSRSWTARDIDVDPKWVAFWQAYPSSKDKGHARNTWLKVLREGVDPDRLVEGALAYRNDRIRKRDFTKHAGTWLNGECWNDYEPKDEEPEFPTPRPFWEN